MATINAVVGELGYCDVARALLAREGLEEAQVRLLPWDEAGRAGVRCHVYVGTTGLFPTDPLWVWWSPVVETPEELQVALEDALRGRTVERRRQPRVALFPL